VISPTLTLCLLWSECVIFNNRSSGEHGRALMTPREEIAPVFDEAFYTANRTYGVAGPPEEEPEPIEDFLDAAFADELGFALIAGGDPDSIFADSNAAFDASGYLRAYPDVAETGMNPLVHYVRHGEGEMLDGLRSVGDFGFDPVFYAAANPDVAAAVEDVTASTATVRMSLRVGTGMTTFLGPSAWRAYACADAYAAEI